MNPSAGFLPCLWLFATEPTDRALAGWCAVPKLYSEGAAQSYVVSSMSSGGMYGTTP